MKLMTATTYALTFMAGAAFPAVLGYVVVTSHHEEGRQSLASKQDGGVAEPSRGDSAVQAKADQQEFSQRHKLGPDTDFVDRLNNLMNRDHPDYVHEPGLDTARQDILTQQYLEIWSKHDPFAALAWAAANQERTREGNKGFQNALLAVMDRSPERAEAYLDLIDDRNELSDLIQIYTVQKSRKGEFDEARRWVSSLDDSRMRSIGVSAVVHAIKGQAFMGTGGFSIDDVIEYIVDESRHLDRGLAENLAYDAARLVDLTADPGQAIIRLTDKAQDYQASIVNGVLSSWIQFAPARAQGWIEEQPDGLLKDQAHLALVELNAFGFNVEHDLIEDIGDENLKSAAFAHLAAGILTSEAQQKNGAASLRERLRDYQFLDADDKNRILTLTEERRS